MIEFWRLIVLTILVVVKEEPIVEMVRMLEINQLNSRSHINIITLIFMSAITFATSMRGFRARNIYFTINQYIFESNVRMYHLESVEVIECQKYLFGNDLHFHFWKFDFNLRF